MDSSMSYSLENFYMSIFETETSEELQCFPRIWFIHVDAAFAVLDTRKSNVIDLAQSKICKR